MDRSGAERIRVGVADMAVTADGHDLLTSGLGSCVAVAVHDGNGIGGLLHAMLPEAPDDVVSKAKYVDSGIEAMKADLADLGADTDTLQAKMAGGSSMLDLGNDEPVGDKNVAATKETLADASIKLVDDDTGGSSGRSVTFHPPSGVMRIERVNAETKEL